MRKLYSIALVLLVALGAKAATVIAATCFGCYPPCRPSILRTVAASMP